MYVKKYEQKYITTNNIITLNNIIKQNCFALKNIYFTQKN